jgi:hypothetical protein
VPTTKIYGRIDAEMVVVSETGHTHKRSRADLKRMREDASYRPLFVIECDECWPILRRQNPEVNPLFARKLSQLDNDLKPTWALNPAEVQLTPDQEMAEAQVSKDGVKAAETLARALTAVQRNPSLLAQG